MEKKEITQKEVEDYILKGMTDALLNEKIFTVDFTKPIEALGGKVKPTMLADALRNLQEAKMINVRMPNGAGQGIGKD
ncbi:unnamed protein product [marine sediment metagenome]|uniref:Uncharacterized protein n=1 Tax=marine sediment metagenome TaxID=412755 RepID=X1GZK3_9ZZZZ